MKPALILFCALSLLLVPASAQVIIPSQKFSAADLKNDLAFLQEQLFTVHANAFTEIDRVQYEQLFRKTDRSIRDSMMLIDFFKLIKPTIANLSDEHAEISLPKELASYRDMPLFLPFSIREQNHRYEIDAVLSADAALKKGQIITKIEDRPVEEWLQRCAAFTTGYPDQRMREAMEQFGYLFALASPFRNSFTLTLAGNREVNIKGIPYAPWDEYLQKIKGRTEKCDPLISYRKIGETGYINACSFGTRGNKEFEKYGQTVDSIFTIARKEGVKKILIDVSHNGGGNSALGDFMIRQFYSGELLTYQMNWKRSDSYLQTIKSWGITNKEYEQLKPGEVMHYGPDTSWVTGVKEPYKGKVYILIGNGTFSSAIMFATLIKDSRIATLVGQAPKDGHPTHFGELYSVNLPHTGLAVRFGVKEWIRPAGKNAGNVLEPDIRIDPELPLEEIIQKLPD